MSGTVLNGKHTAGIWSISERLQYVRYKQSDGTKANIASLECFGGPPEEHKANAYLIAEAPSLLAALQTIYDELPTTVSPQEFLEGHGNWGLTEREYHIATVCAKAIVKAVKP